jgi:dienelactone hydrolase
MTSFRRTSTAIVALSAVALSGCALWFGRPAPPVESDTLLKSDEHMKTFGFTVLEKGAEPAAFGAVRRVYKKGAGPRVILLHELPGLRDGDIRAGVALADHFEVYMPLLFGTAGQDKTSLGIRQACRGGLFKCNDRDTRHPIAIDLVAMARQVCGPRERPDGSAGPGGLNECGVVGMCLTGTVPLAMTEAEGVVALVLAQPTLPVVWHIWPFAGVDISRQDTTAAVERAVARRASIYMVRYEDDRISGRKAFRRLAARIAPAKDKLSFFAAIEVRGNGHSTLVHDHDHPHVAPAQLEAVVDALNARLAPAKRGE